MGQQKMKVSHYFENLQNKSQLIHFGWGFYNVVRKRSIKKELIISNKNLDVMEFSNFMSTLNKLEFN